MRWLLALLTLPMCCTALAAQPPAAQALSSLREAAERYVQASAPAGAQARADALDARLRLPACTGALQTAGAPRGGSAHWNVAVSCDSPQRWTLYVPVRVTQLLPVAIAARDLPAGTLLSEQDFRSELRDAATLSRGYVSALPSVAGARLTRPLASGAALSPDLLGRPTAVRRGQAVVLIGRVGPLEVRAQGKAMADAATGDHLQVENSASRRIVHGRVREDGAVDVQL